MAATPIIAMTCGVRPCATKASTTRLRHQWRHFRAGPRLLPDGRRRRQRGRAPEPIRHRRREPEPRSAPPAGRARSRNRSRAICTAGPSGAGHFVKMVHNGIEYGIMAALAEGLNILRNADVGTRTDDHDAEMAPLRNPGSTNSTSTSARSPNLAPWHGDRLLAAGPDRGRTARSPDYGRFSGRVSDSGEGRWTVMAAIDEGCRRRCCRRRCTSDSPRGAWTISPTRRSPRCASSSAATTRNPVLSESRFA